jgi:isopentenyldiphosphate isomerase
VQQNDPTELLEVFDAAGRPTGRGRTRAEIHLDGYWHQAFHCWIVRRGGRQVVLQRRSPAKDTFGGYWDAAAAGHWRFGESAEQAAREIQEELGLQVSFGDLTYRGRETLERSFDNGLTDREHHQVYVLHYDAALTLYRPDPEEVVGLAAFPTEGLLGLLGGVEVSVTASEAVTVTPRGTLERALVSIGVGDVVPYSAARLRRTLGRT